MVSCRIIRVTLILITGLFCVGAHAQTSKVDWVTSVVLPGLPYLDPARVSSSIQKRLTTADKFSGFESGENLILLRVGGGTALVSLIDAPIPNRELQEVCEYAWYWKAACDTVNSHKAHLLVVLMGTELDKLGAAILQTKIVAGLLEATDAVAVYWGVNLQPRAAFLTASAGVSRTSIPAMLWVSYRVSREGSGNLSLSTRGLQDFGLMEIEAKDAPMPGRDLFELVLGATEYLITKGPVIRDGDTIGQSSRQRIRVHHGESYWNAGEKVYRLDFGG